MKFSYFFFISMVPLAAIAQPSYDPTDDLLSAFGETCSVRADINQKARAQGQALVSIISNMKSDPACAGLAPMVENLQSQLMNTYADIDIAEIDRDRKRELAADIDQAIQVEKSKGALGDPLFIANAQSDLSALRMDILRENNIVSTKKRKNMVGSVDTARVSVNQVLSSLSTSSQCATQKPNIAGQIVGRLLAITSILNPGAIGAASLGIGSIFENLMNFFSQQKFDKAVGSIRKDQLMDGIGCGLEAMAATQCMARDTIVTLKEANQNLVEANSCSESMIGAEIMGKHLTGLVSWIKEFRDASMSSMQKQVLSDAQEARQLDFAYDSLANALNINFSNFEKKDDTINTRKELLEDLTNTMSNYSSWNIGFKRIFEFDQECGPYIFLFSEGNQKGRDRLPDNANNNYRGSGAVSPACISYVSIKNMPTPSAGAIRAAKDKILFSLKDYVEETKRRLKSADPKLILASAENKSASGASPIETINGLFAYLAFISDGKIESRSGKSLRTMATENRDRLGRVLQSYEDEKVTDQQLAKIIVENIGHEDFLRNISEIVRLDIENKFKSGKTSEGFKMIAEASSASAIAELTIYINDTERLYASANAAKVHSDSNLKIFTQTFQEPFEDILKDLQERSKESAAAKNMLGLSCMRALLAREPPKYLKSYCNNSSYDGLIGGAISYDSWVEKPYDNRVCSLFDYFRKTRVKEMRGTLKEK